MKRKLTLAQAIEAAAILFELNTDERGALAIAERAGLPVASEEERAAFLWEWRAYVHAAVLYGLMVQAPNVVVVEYLRSTQSILRRLGYSEEQATDFVDGPFRAYSDPMVKTQTQECPAVFFRRLLKKELTDVPAQTVAMMSGVMAMVMSATLDKLEQYEYGLE
ncbi:MAG: hypothetical protein IKJ34_06245 [Mailhella sp.]|nr:hypothetical protein [Mailhella sp.]